MDKNWFKRFPDLLLVSILVSAVLQGCVTPKKAVVMRPESETLHAASRFDAHLLSSEAIDGSLMIAEVAVPAGVQSDGAPLGEYEGLKFSFFEVPAQTGKAYEAVFAVPFNHKPEQTKVIVSWGDSRMELPLLVKDGNYPSEKLKVDERKVNPRKSDLVRIRRDLAETARIYQHITEKKYWNGPFVLPIDSVITSRFGTKRVFNGEMKSFHGGLDLRAKEGTPIYAAAPGVVVLAKSLFFTGNTVMIDHGYGVVSIYAHMSRLKVKVGQEVQTRDLLGLSGKTGRVSGPHLHWQVAIHKQKVNPLDLTRVMK